MYRPTDRRLISQGWFVLGKALLFISRRVLLSSFFPAGNPTAFSLLSPFKLLFFWPPRSPNTTNELNGNRNWPPPNGLVSGGQGGKQMTSHFVRQSREMGKKNSLRRKKNKYAPLFIHGANKEGKFIIITVERLRLVYSKSR